MRVVRIRYRSGTGKVSNRDVEPVLFASTRGEWFFIGWCRMRCAIRWFAVSGIERASVTTVPCEGHTVEEVGTPPPNARPSL